MRYGFAAILTLVALLGASRTAPAGEVSFEISSQTTYVGAPITFEIAVTGAEMHDPPVFPNLDWANVRLETGRSSSISIMFGRTTETVTHTYRFSITPRTPGTYTIPTSRIRVDGEWRETGPTQILVKKSDPGDLLFVRLMGEQEAVYVGEPVDVTLEIRLRQFVRGRTRLDQNDMWSCVDKQNSTWGPFVNLLNNRSRQISVRAEARRGADGAKHRYFVYSLTHQVWPERPGVFDAGGINIVVQYPTRVERGFFGSSISRVRPIALAPEPSTITVKPLPDEGKPPSFRGAVGEYSMNVKATPTEVSVGDPITLTMAFRGTGRLDVLQAPLLNELSLLTGDFRVPDEPLAGVVERGVKTFTQSIRAKHSDVRAIPPIEFSYFDPRAERYVSITSDPIPISVAESTRVSVSQIVESGGLKAGRTELTAIDEGLLANYEDLDALLGQMSLVPGWGTWGFVGGSPLVYAFCLLVRRHRTRLASDTAFARRRSAHKAAMAMIRQAAQPSDPGEGEDVRSLTVAAWCGAAVARFVADRCNIPEGGVTAAEAIRRLRDRGVPADVISRVEDLLGECERMRYAGAAQADSNDLPTRARRCVNELQRRSEL